MQQYIGFYLNDNEYSIPILKVREIINMPAITKLPNSPYYIDGVTNLRGMIIPIVNLKRLVKLDDADKRGSKVIVVSSGNITFGVLVDGIAGVVNIEESSIEHPEKFINENLQQVEGVAKVNDRLVVLLNEKKLLPSEDLSLFEDIIVDVNEIGDDGKVEVVKSIQTMAGEVKVKELHDVKEFLKKKGIDVNDPRYLIFDDVMNFMSAIANQDYKGAEDAMQDIMRKGQGSLFNEVGKITRKLHDAVKDFKEAIDPRLKDIAASEMPSAIDSLQFVIDKTEEAANRTMGIVEKYMANMEDLASHIRKLEGPDDSLKYLKEFRDNFENDLTEILTTQSFQDLTGQAIKKVIKLVGDIEAELVRLITTFGVKMEGVEEEHIMAEKVSQSDVDELLKEFGF